MSDYTMKQTLMDLTILSMTANQTLNIGQDGFGSGTNFTTPGGPTTTATSGAWAVEVTDIEIQYPRDASGNYEDAREIFPVVDGTPLQHYINLSGVGSSGLFPVHTRYVGGRIAAVSFGRPLWKLAEQALGGFQNPVARAIANLPLKSTTLKYAVNFGIGVHAVSAITGAGAPLRIIVKGYRYDDTDLAQFAAAFSGAALAIAVQTKGRRTRNLTPLTATFVPGGPLSIATWSSYPGGIGQKGVRIMPTWRIAYNASATAANTPFVFSANGSVGGASSNIEDPFQDLGFVGTNNQNALIVQGLGVVPVTAAGTPSHLARFGFQIDGTQYPRNFGGPGEGQFVGDTVNDHYFGDSGRYRGSDGTGISGRYGRLPRVVGEPILLYGNTGVPFVVSDSAAGIPQNGVVLAMSGISVEQS